MLLVAKCPYPSFPNRLIYVTRLAISFSWRQLVENPRLDRFVLLYYPLVFSLWCPFDFLTDLTLLDYDSLFPPWLSEYINFVFLILDDYQVYKRGRSDSHCTDGGDPCIWPNFKVNLTHSHTLPITQVWALYLWKFVALKTMLYGVTSCSNLCKKITKLALWIVVLMRICLILPYLCSGTCAIMSYLDGFYIRY